MKFGNENETNEATTKRNILKEEKALMYDLYKCVINNFS